MSPSVFYFIALFIWPIVTYKVFRKYDIELATVLSVVLAILLLPMPLPAQYAPIDLPVLPPLDKNFIPIASLYIVLVSLGVKLTYLPRSLAPKAVCLLLLACPIFTTLSNMDALHYGPKVLPGLGFKDGASSWVAKFFETYIPFVIGYSILNTDDAHKKFVRVIAVSGLLYSLLMLYEVRMSPQLHSDIYGFFPHEWKQQKRGGGFRPVVFLGHGLEVAFHFTIVVVCLYASIKENSRVFNGWGKALLVYSVIVLVLCKTMSALIYCIVYFCIMFTLKNRGVLTFSYSMVLLLLLYPLIRSGVPLDSILEFFQGVNPERAESLLFRFENEELLLAHAQESPVFGWGGWGRNLVFDYISGVKLTIPDGSWIVVLGLFGWCGYLGHFGLLVSPIHAIRKRAKAKKSQVEPGHSTYALIFVVGIVALDQVPNSSMGQLFILIAGALMGWSDRKAGLISGVNVKRR